MNDTVRTHLKNWVYRCDLCNARFSHWLLNTESWAATGIPTRAVLCKPCFEKICPGEHHYETIEEIVAYQAELHPGSEKSIRELLLVARALTPEELKHHSYYDCTCTLPELRRIQAWKAKQRKRK